MAFDITDLVQGMIASRAWFMKHLRGVTDDQWNWKPYPECKSIRETLQHLIVDDLAALDSLKSGVEPNYEAFTVTETDISKLMHQLERTHAELVGYLRDSFGDKPLDSDICVWGHNVKLGRGIPHLSSEDYYHAGQVSFIRLATDPKWNYYADLYGE